MTDIRDNIEVPVVKDESNELPIPSVWRPIFRQIVKAFVIYDYRLESAVSGVMPISAATAEHVEQYISDYGETLIELPEETWESSVCIWMGDRWDVLVDLWSLEEGRSDLVLSMHVSESTAGFAFEVYMVYVP